MNPLPIHRSFQLSLHMTLVKAKVAKVSSFSFKMNVSFLLVWFLCFFFNNFCRPCDIKIVVLPNKCPWVPEGKDVRSGARKIFDWKGALIEANTPLHFYANREVKLLRIPFKPFVLIRWRKDWNYDLPYLKIRFCVDLTFAHVLISTTFSFFVWILKPFINSFFRFIWGHFVWICTY